MHRILFLLLFVLYGGLASAQVLVINELDCDTPGIDDKEFVEIRSQTPEFPLDGYVLVFFNGSASGGNTSYLALDLDGYTTDINGLLLIGSSTVVPFPQYIIPTNVIQNGEDALAIYQADADDFPPGTLAYADQTLIDVLIYGTNDPVAAGMITIFQAFNPAIQQINEGAGNNTNSIQRNNDGTYFTGSPTPRRLNDGTGIQLNGVMLELQSSYNEGDVMTFTFQTEQPVSADLTLSFTLNNGSFNSADFTGSTTVTIPVGQQSVTTQIQLQDDNLDEGDEVMVVRIAPVPVPFLLLRNNIRVRIVDNDFRVADYGTPLEPTYGVVSSTQPSGYYDPIVGLAGDSLQDALQQLIADEATVRTHSYADVIDIILEADQHPKNSNQVWLVYLEQGRAKLDLQTSTTNIGVWNREHTFPRSRGGFGSIDQDTLRDGINLFWTTNADSLRHANSDAHGIRAASAEQNVARGNRFYGQYSGPAGNLGSFKGDVARSVFFLAVRYNGLELVPGYPEGMVGQFGNLDTLLAWHRQDPPDDYEMNRNNIVYQWQNNRNPFIDEPDLVEYLWGNRVGEQWMPSALETVSNPLESIRVYPNPTHGGFYLAPLSGNVRMDIFSAAGVHCYQGMAAGQMMLNPDLPPGLYVIRCYMGEQVVTKKLVIRGTN
jgi:hypothetical protein